MSQSDSAFWALADELERLRSELKTLTRPGGQLRGFSVGGFESPARKQARVLSGQIEAMTVRFKRAQADYAGQMRDHVRALVAEGQTLASAADMPRPQAKGGEFAALRETARAEAREEAAMVNAFETTKAKLSRR